MQEDTEQLGQLCSVLPMLAYGDVAQEPWQDLRAGDCVHFIQLAQCALEFMLSQAHDVHMTLVRFTSHLLCPLALLFHLKGAHHRSCRTHAQAWGSVA